MRRSLVSAAILLLFSTAALAQSRPLVTEDPETVPPGNLLLEGGLDFGHDAVFPVSGLRGNLWRLGTFGVSIGISSIAEIQLDGGFRNHLSIKSMEPGPLSSMLDLKDPFSTQDVEDGVIGVKVRFVQEDATRPAVAVRFFTKLPNASNENGLGNDTTDFHFHALVGKTVQSVRVVANVGFGILGDPARGDRQNDVLDYGLSVARAVRQGVEVVGELNGWQNMRSGAPIIGTDSRATMRMGARLTRGPVRADAALTRGVTDRDPTWGFSTGLTYVFKAFTVPSSN